MRLMSSQINSHWSLGLEEEYSSALPAMMGLFHCLAPLRGEYFHLLGLELNFRSAFS